MILPIVRELTVLCCIMCLKSSLSQASVPVPKLFFSTVMNKSNIVLNSLVPITCDVPRGAPLPVAVSVGRLDSQSQTPETTEAWVTIINSKYWDTASYEIPAIDKYEGEIVCWYKSIPNGPTSGFSNTLTIVASALPPPKVTLSPHLFISGGNYTVFCESAAGSTALNFTLALFYRVFPVTPGTNWSLVGSVPLKNGYRLYSTKTNVITPVEFACSMEMMYKGKVLHSPLSNITQAIPGKGPMVRLFEQDRGESCLGYLDVNLSGKWQPACQKELKAEADLSAAAATAIVVCRELGCGDALEWKRRLEDKRKFSETVAGIRCSGNEKNIRDCPMDEIELCTDRNALYIICSGALPRPKLSVVSYGPVSKAYVRDEQDVEISCSIDSTYLKANDYGYMILSRDGVSLDRTFCQPGQTVSIRQYAKVLEGEYECAFSFGSFVSQASNSVFIYIYNPPDPVPIVAGVLTTAIGLAILAYICVYRTTTEEVLTNELPAHSQDPTTNTENVDNNVCITQQP